MLAHRTRESVARPPRIVCASTRQSGSANVGANIGVAQRLPPCEPCVPALPASADDHNEERNAQQPDEERDRYQDAGPDLHSSAPSAAPISDCNLRSALD